jgi:hypothetical protein
MAKHGRYTVELNSGGLPPETDDQRLARIRRVAQELGYDDSFQQEDMQKGIAQASRNFNVSRPKDIRHG